MTIYTKTTDFQAKDALASGNPLKIVKGTEIDDEFDAIAAADATNLKKDGTVAATGNIPMGTYKFTGLGAGAAATDSVNLGQVQEGAYKRIGSISGTDTITGSLTPAISSYVNGQKFSFISAGANTGAVTININGLGAKSITKLGTTALAAGDIPSGAIVEIEYDGTRFQLCNLASQTTASIASGATAVTQSFADNSTKIATTEYVDRAYKEFDIDASVAANALTITLNPCRIAFRSTTLTDGTPVVRYASTATLTISSGSTLGTTNGVQSDIVVLAIDNAGTVELAAVNISGGNQLDETNLISTTAEGGAGAADSASTIYSTTARSNVAYRVVGIVRSTQATAGTWASTPTLVQSANGNALTAMQSLGYGQTLQDVTASRAGATTYYNTTGKPIKVYVQGNGGASSAEFSFSINGGSAVPFARCDLPSGVANLCGTFDVPIGASYRVTASVGGFNLTKWWEQR